MEYEKEFEDERIIQWRIAEGSERPGADPTVLEVDLLREEPFESRVYAVRPEPMAALTAAAAAEHPEVRSERFVLAYLSGMDATFRIFAKRDKSDLRITAVLVGVFAGTRTLLERRDALLEDGFRSWVEEAEQELVDGGVVDAPTVITLEEWRSYAAIQEQASPDRPPEGP